MNDSDALNANPFPVDPNEIFVINESANNMSSQNFTSIAESKKIRVKRDASIQKSEQNRYYFTPPSNKMQSAFENDSKNLKIKIDAQHLDNGNVTCDVEQISED